MSGSERRRVEAKERLRLLETVYPFFRLSLPTIPPTTDTQNGEYKDVSEADLANDITILRLDIKALPITLRPIDIDQVRSDDKLDQLIQAFDSVLSLFEDSVINRTAEGTQPPQVRT